MELVPDLARLVDEANDILYVHDLEGRLLWVNQAAVERFGYERSEIVGKHMSALLDQESLKGALQRLEQKVRGREDRSGPYEVRVRDSNGGTVWLEVSSRLQRDAAGRPSCVHGIARDITHRKHQQEALELLHTFSSELNAVPDLETALGRVVANICQAAGWAYGEAWTTQDGVLRATDAWYGAGAALGRFRRVSSKAEYRCGEGLLGSVWQQGKPRWIRDVAAEPSFHLAVNARAAGLRSMVAVPVSAGDGELTAMFVWMQEQTRDSDWPWVHMAGSLAVQLGSLVARRKAEDRLQWQAALLQGQLEAAPYAVMVVSEQGDVVAANKKLLTMCRVRPLAQGPLPADGRSVTRLVDRPERFGDCARYLYEDPAADGTVELAGHRYRRTSKRLHDRDDLPLGRILTFEDVTSKT